MCHNEDSGRCACLFCVPRPPKVHYGAGVVLSYLAPSCLDLSSVLLVLVFVLSCLVFDSCCLLFYVVLSCLEFCVAFFCVDSLLSCLFPLCCPCLPFLVFCFFLSRLVFFIFLCIALRRHNYCLVVINLVLSWIVLSCPCLLHLFVHRSAQA